MRFSTISLRATPFKRLEFEKPALKQLATDLHIFNDGFSTFVLFWGSLKLSDNYFTLNLMQVLLNDCLDETDGLFYKLQSSVFKKPRKLSNFLVVNLFHYGKSKQKYFPLRYRHGTITMYLQFDFSTTCLI